MRAICVTPGRELEVCNIPTPTVAATGHVLIDLEASAINHGDKTFLRMPSAAGNALPMGQNNVWGASGAGRVVALGAGVPAEYADSQVAIYRSLSRSPKSIGLWCERAHVPYTTCLILPEDVRARDYCGSLVNVITAYAFLEEIVEAGHKGVIVTAGNSATGHALAALAESRQLPAIFLVRTEEARETLGRLGAEHVIVTREGFTDTLSALSAKLGTTAVFDGIGGDLLTSIAPGLPMNSTVYCYGFLGGAVPVSIQSVLVMMKNLTLKRFSNFESRTVKDHDRLVSALKALEGVIHDPVFRTRMGKEFPLDQVELAMAYESLKGEKAILLT